MKRQNNDPSRLTVRYTGRCSKCGKKLPKGSQAYYWPKGSNLLCEECGAEDFLSFLSSVADEEVYNGIGNPY